MVFKKFVALTMAGVMIASILTGCGGKKAGNAAGESGQQQSAQTENLPDIEVWNTNTGYLPIEKGSQMYNFYKEKTGVGIIQPYIEWSNYQQALNLKIAAGEMPDMFLPVNGMESDLAKSGAILDLTDILPKKAPKLYEDISKNVWDIVKSYDPNSNGRIYSIPSILDYGRTGGVIRKDWLDKLGMSMPKTQDEFVKVLEAFRDKDPNGNGQKDEIPTGGRQQAKWMDHLFAMYGLAMWEGDPQWDMYDGKLTYSAVTPNMKDAVAFMAKLYSQGLLDKETFLNDKTKWDAKIDANRVGVYFHWPEGVSEHLQKIDKAASVKADYAVLPAIDAPGYKGFYTEKQMVGATWVLKNQKDESKINACMKVLNAYGDKSLWNDFYLGVKDMHYTEKDGKPAIIPVDKTKMQNRILYPYNDIATIDFSSNLFKSATTSENQWAYEQNTRNMKENQKYVKTIAGDGIASTVYDGYPDIKNKTLYVEYITKIIIGEYPISKFDEFVDKWNKSGGEAVTKAARDWYAKVKK